MAIRINNKEYLSYEEQVLKNKKDIEELKELLGFVKKTEYKKGDMLKMPKVGKSLSYMCVVDRDFATKSGELYMELGQLDADDSDFGMYVGSVFTLSHFSDGTINAYINGDRMGTVLYTLFVVGENNITKLVELQ